MTDDGEQTLTASKRDGHHLIKKSDKPVTLIEARTIRPNVQAPGLSNIVLCHTSSTFAPAREPISGAVAQRGI